MSTCVIKFDPRTMFVDIVGLKPNERAALFSLLLEMWSQEGHIEHNEKDNARSCHMRPTSVRKALAGLVDREWLEVIDGRIYPGRRVQRAMRRVGLAPEQRAAVLMDERVCRYCGNTEGPFEVDHIYPASRGGTNHRRNLTLACWPCNMAKRDFTLSELEGGR